GDGVRLEVDTARVDRAFARSFADRLALIVESGRARPGQVASAVPLVSDDERARLLELARGPVMPIDPGTIVDAFEASVDRNASSVALVAGGERLTYRELDERANGVARMLERLAL